MSIHCNPKVVSDNLILYLDAANKKSYPKYGLKYWGDMSKYENHFSMIGNLNLINESFVFQGSIENYFASADNFNHPTTELTVEMWVLPSVEYSPNAAFYSFISNDSKTLYHSITGQSNIILYGPRSSISTDISILDGTWKCVTRTSLRNTGDEKLYINGNLVFSGNVDPLINFNSAGIILLGEKTTTSGSLDYRYPYVGNMAIFKIYNKVLTADEVKSNFNAVKGRFYPYIATN